MFWGGFVVTGHWYVKVFEHAFDGASTDMDQLTVAQRWIWVALIAWSRKYRPHGELNTVKDGISKPVGLRRLAQWCGASKTAVADAIAKLLELGMLKKDRRKNEPVLRVANWSKWQLANGDDEDEMGVRQTDRGCPPDGQPEDLECAGCPPDGQKCPPDGQKCPSGGHLSLKSECPPDGHIPDEPLRENASRDHIGVKRGVRLADDSQRLREESEKGLTTLSPAAPAQQAHLIGMEQDTVTTGRRAETPDQQCIRRAWEAHGLEGVPGGTDKQYGRLVAIIRQHGIPLVDEWAAIVKAEGPTLPDGADPWRWFCGRMLDAFKAVWKWHTDGGGADARERERREFDKPGWTSPSRSHPKVGGVYVHGVGIIPAGASPGVGEMDPGTEGDS